MSHDKIDLLGATSPAQLSATRVELHWLSQVLGAAGDGFLERAPDDSQSNLVWDAEKAALVGRLIGNGTQLGLAIASAELVVFSEGRGAVERKPARGNTLAGLLDWATGALARNSQARPGAPLKTRDYEMPSHSVASGQPFAFPDRQALDELQRWFANSTIWLKDARTVDPRAGAVRCWPHHFDIGGIIMLEPDKPFSEARQIGFGWAPGDASYDQPYFYITPFPVPDSLPALTCGHWHREGFTGAILTGQDVVAAGDKSAQDARVRCFLRSTMEGAIPLVSP